MKLLNPSNEVPAPDWKSTKLIAPPWLIALSPSSFLSWPNPFNEIGRRNLRVIWQFSVSSCFPGGFEKMAQNADQSRGTFKGEVGAVRHGFGGFGAVDCDLHCCQAFVAKAVQCGEGF